MLELLESFDNETLDLVAGYPNAGEDEYIENFSATDPDPAEEDLYAKELEILNTIQETLNSNDVDKAARVAALARDFTSLRK